MLLAGWKGAHSMEDASGQKAKQTQVYGLELMVQDG